MELYRNVEIPPWPNFPDDNPNRPRIHELVIPTESWRSGWSFWESAVRHYFAFMSLIDQQIGRVLHGLQEIAAGDNTVIIFTADHGESIGAHGCQNKGLFMYEEIYRVPLFVCVPGVIPRREGALTTTVDLCPMILDLAGADHPEKGRDGLSLIRLLDEPGTAWRSSMVAEYHGMGPTYTQRLIAGRRFKYVWNMGDRDECYDLVDDPYELRNLAEPDRAGEPLRQLREELLAWMEQMKDPALPYYRRYLSHRYPAIHRHL